MFFLFSFTPSLRYVISDWGCLYVYVWWELWKGEERGVTAFTDDRYCISKQIDKTDNTIRKNLVKNV